MSSFSDSSASRLLPLEIFCSYAQNQKDDTLLRELEQQLLPYQREGRLMLRHQGQIGFGENRAEVLRQWEARASVILLMISSAFLASDECVQDMWVWNTRMLSIHSLA